MTKHRETEVAFVAAVLMLFGIAILALAGVVLGWIAFRIDYRIEAIALAVAIIAGFLFSRPIGFGLLLVAVVGIPVVALLFVNFRAGLVSVGVVVLAALAVVLIPVAWSHWQAQEWLLLVVASALVSVAASFYLFFPRSFSAVLPTSPFGGPATGGGESTSLDRYRATIRPVGSTFRLVERITVTEYLLNGTPVHRTYSLKPRVLTSTSHGLLLNQVSFMPLGATPQPSGSPTINVTLRDHNVLQTPLCPDDRCPPVTVEVKRLPDNSFYQALDAAVTAVPDIHGQKAEWSPNDFDLMDPIAFSYIPSPWEPLRDPLARFIGIASVGGFLAALFGLMYGTVLAAILAFSRKHWYPAVLALVHRLPGQADRTDADGATSVANQVQGLPSIGLLTITTIAIDMKQNAIVLTAENGDVATLSGGPQGFSLSVHPSEPGDPATDTTTGSHA